MVYRFLYQHRCQEELETLYTADEYPSLPNPLEVLDDNRDLSVSDPRDKIYAFRSLPFLEGQQFALEPDYQQSLPQVYRDFAIEYARANSNLEILSYVSYNRAQDHLYSSWAPRWDDSGGWPRAWFPCIKPGLPLEDPDGDSQALVVETEKDGSRVILRTRGVIFDDVSMVSDPLGPSTTMEDVQALWNDMRERSIPDGLGRAHNYLAFLNALILGEKFLGPSWPEWVALMCAYALYLGVETPHPLGPTTNQHSVLKEAHQEAYLRNRQDEMHSPLFRSSLPRRRLIRLAGGLYGSVQDICKTGDAFALIFGALTPLILRRVPGGGELMHTSESWGLPM